MVVLAATAHEEIWVKMSMRILLLIFFILTSPFPGFVPYQENGNKAGFSFSEGEYSFSMETAVVQTQTDVRGFQWKAVSCFRQRSKIATKHDLKNALLRSLFLISLSQRSSCALPTSTWTRVSLTTRESPRGTSSHSFQNQRPLSMWSQVKQV